MGFTWRKGLRWDKALGVWVSVVTGKPLTELGLQRRKTMAKKGTLKIAKRKPKSRPRSKAKVKPKEKSRKKPKKKPEKKPKPRSKKGKAFEAIKKVMDFAKACLKSDYAVDTRIHENKDGSIDSELRIKPKRGQQVNDIFLDMEGCVTAIPNTWVSTGIRYKPREREEYYIRFKGLSQANSYYQRNTQRKLATNFVTGRRINERMEVKGRRKPEQVIMRVHWNAKNTKPERG